MNFRPCLTAFAPHASRFATGNGFSPGEVSATPSTNAHEEQSDQKREVNKSQTLQNFFFNLTAYIVYKRILSYTNVKTFCRKMKAIQARCYKNVQFMAFKTSQRIRTTTASGGNAREFLDHGGEFGQTRTGFDDLCK